MPYDPMSKKSMLANIIQLLHAFLWHKSNTLCVCVCVCTRIIARYSHRCIVTTNSCSLSLNLTVIERVGVCIRCMHYLGAH